MTGNKTEEILANNVDVTIGSIDIYIFIKYKKYCQMSKFDSFLFFMI